MSPALIPADDEVTRRELIELAREALSFLEDRTTRTTKVKNDQWSAIIPYVLVALTFELHIEWREKHADLLVCRTVNGRRPPGYYMYEGRRMRMHLAKAIEEFGTENDKVALPELRRLAGRNGYDAIRDQILSFGPTLHQALDGLLNRADEIFPD